MSNSFCIYPWTHIQLKPNGQAKPCCRFNHMKTEYKDKFNNSIMKDLNINKKSLSEIYHSDFWNKLRQDMLDGTPIPGCEKCNADDEAGKYSMRFNANRAWNEMNQASPISPNKQPSFKFLELTTGRYCNLKCRMCSSDLSTTWENDDKIIKGKYKDSISGEYRQEYSHLPKVLNLNFLPENFKETKLIKLTGGEPMIAPTFLPFIDTIIDSGYEKNIILEIYTNASWTPKDKILDRLKKFKYTKIFLSIDGIEKVNDYIRAPSEWDVVNESAETWLNFSKNNPSFSIIWSPTINLYNILNLLDMMNWWDNLQKKYFTDNFALHITDEEEYAMDNEIGYIFNVGRWSPTWLHTPAYLSASLLPDKNDVINSLKEFTDEKLEWALSEKEIALAKRFQYMIDHIINNFKQKPKDNLQTFINFSADLDKLRNQNLQQDLPELWSQIK